MRDIVVDRNTIIYIYGVEGGLFPNQPYTYEVEGKAVDSDILYPANDVFPNKTTLVIEGSQTDNGVVDGSLQVNEILVDGELKFGQCYANRFECELYNVSEDIANKRIKVFQRQDGNYVPVFAGYIDSATLDVFNLTRKVIAYDEFYTKRDYNVSAWWTEFWQITVDPSGKYIFGRDKATLKQIRESVCDYIAMPYSTEPLVNDSIEVSAYSAYSNISFTDVITFVCELQGCFPNIDREGNLEFLYFGTTGKSIIGDYERGNISFEDYETDTITGINIFDTSDNIVQTYPLNGSGRNAYSIAGNIFLLNMTTAQITSVMSNLYPILQNFKHIPFEVPMIVSDFGLKLGDKITHERGFSYVMKQEFSGPLLVEQTIESVAKGAMLKQEASSVNNLIAESYKTSKILQTIDEISTEVADATGRISTLTQTVDGIETEVSKKVGNTEIISKINQSAEQIDIQANKVQIVGNVSINDVFSLENNIVKYTGGLNVSTPNKTYDAIKLNYTFNSGGYRVTSYTHLRPNGFTCYGNIPGAEGETSTEMEPNRIVLNDNGYWNVIDAHSGNTSDRRLKTDIQDIDPKYCQLIDKLEPKQFRYTYDRDRLRFGFIAQDVEQLLIDEDIKDSPIVNPPGSKSNYYQIDYTDLVPLLCNVVKEQGSRITELENRLEALEHKEETHAK